MKSCRHRSRLVGELVLAAALVSLGCLKNDGLSDADRAKLAEDEVVQTLESQGAKLKQIAHPLGSPWVIDMHGLSITDDQIRLLKKFRFITELNLSKSTISDDQLALLHELELDGLLLKLDLSDTAVTDAGVGKLSCPYMKELNVGRTKVSSGVAAAVKKKK